MSTSSQEVVLPSSFTDMAASSGIEVTYIPRVEETEIDRGFLLLRGQTSVSVAPIPKDRFDAFVGKDIHSGFRRVADIAGVAGTLALSFGVEKMPISVSSGDARDGIFAAAVLLAGGLGGLTAIDLFDGRYARKQHISAVHSVEVTTHSAQRLSIESFAGDMPDSLNAKIVVPNLQSPGHVLPARARVNDIVPVTTAPYVPEIEGRETSAYASRIRLFNVTELIPNALSRFETDKSRSVYLAHAYIVLQGLQRDQERLIDSSQAALSDDTGDRVLLERWLNDSLAIIGHAGSLVIAEAALLQDEVVAYTEGPDRREKARAYVQQLYNPDENEPLDNRWALPLVSRANNTLGQVVMPPIPTYDSRQ